MIPSLLVEIFLASVRAPRIPVAIELMQRAQIHRLAVALAVVHDRVEVAVGAAGRDLLERVVPRLQRGQRNPVTRAAQERLYAVSPIEELVDDAQVIANLALDVSDA